MLRVAPGGAHPRPLRLPIQAVSSGFKRSQAVYAFDAAAALRRVCGKRFQLRRVYGRGPRAPSSLCQSSLLAACFGGRRGSTWHNAVLPLVRHVDHVAQRLEVLLVGDLHLRRLHAGAVHLEEALLEALHVAADLLVG